MDINIVLNKLKKVRREGDEYKACCPAHNDKNPSLSVSTDKKTGNLLLHCHAGCTYNEIMRALGMKPQDGFADNKKIDNTIQSKNLIYEYTDKDGNLLFWKEKYYKNGEKRFSFNHKEPDGSSQSGLHLKDGTKIKTVLYNLPEVLKAVEFGKSVFIVEGEKDVETMKKLGFIATTNPDGANGLKEEEIIKIKNGQKKYTSKWKKEFCEYFKGSHKINVIILPDDDVCGNWHANSIANQLYSIVGNIKIVKLPDLKEKGDITDWIELGHTKEELLELIQNTKVFEKKDAISFSKNTLPLTDTGNAERLIRDYGDIIRYCTELKQWFVWDEITWQEDLDFKIERFAKETIRSIGTEEAAYEMDDEKKAKIKKHALKSESARARENMIKLAKSEEDIPISITNFDTNPFLIACKNGTINLNDGSIKESEKNDFISKQLPICYERNKECPTWKAFLYDIMEEDQEMVDFLQKAIGYTITGSIKEQVMFVLLGAGSNGKSLMLETIAAILGENFTKKLNPEVLVSDDYNKNRDAEIARLVGSRFVMAVETEENQKLRESTVKSITGDSKLLGRFLYGTAFEFDTQFKVWLATNHKPQINGTDNGIWRRLILIPFNKRYYKKSEIPDDANIDEIAIADLDLKDKLLDELPGILNWIIEGCLKWQKEGLNLPSKIINATKEYRKEMDVIQCFIDDECMLNPNAFISLKEFLDKFNAYCEANAEYNPFISSKCASRLLSKKLKEKGFEVKKSGVGKNLTTAYGLGVKLSKHIQEEKEKIDYKNIQI